MNVTRQLQPCKPVDVPLRRAITFQRELARVVDGNVRSAGESCLRGKQRRHPATVFHGLQDVANFGDLRTGEPVAQPLVDDAPLNVCHDTFDVLGDTRDDTQAAVVPSLLHHTPERLRPCNSVRAFGSIERRHPIPLWILHLHLFLNRGRIVVRSANRATMASTAIHPFITSRAFVRISAYFSKRGDIYLRTLLIAGARAVVARLEKSNWIDRLLARRHYNVVVVLANTLARTVWAVLAKAWPLTKSGGIRPRLLAPEITDRVFIIRIQQETRFEGKP